MRRSDRLLQSPILTAAFLVLATSAFAAEPVPGDACSTLDYVVETGGPETSGIRHFLRCDGSNWQQELTIDAAGNVGIGTPTPVSPLHIEGGSYETIYLKSTDDIGPGVTLDNVGTGGKAYIVLSSGAGSDAGAGKLVFFDLSNNTPRVVLDTDGNFGIGTVGPNAVLDVNGGVKVGYNAGACSATNEGEIRYDSASNIMEYCNGSAWSSFAGGGGGGGSDETPNSFDFSDVSNAALNSVVESNIVLISGIDTAVDVTIAGAGSPEYRICADGSCSSVIQSWSNGLGSMTNGQFIQARLTSAAAGLTARTATPITVGTESVNWTVTTTAVKFVFATSTTYDADLAGKTGANSKCAARATAAGLSGTFLSWVATSNSDDPESTFAQATVPYVTVNGTVVADNWGDLVDGTLDNPISRDENGNAVTGNAWTNVTTTGAQKQDFPAPCSDFGSNSGANSTFKGLTTSAATTWTDNSTQVCSTFSRIYCFQQ